MDLNTANRLEGELNEKALLRDLASELVNLWMKTGNNPVDEGGAYRATFLERLQHAQVRELRDLMAADQVMDAVVLPELRGHRALKSLHLKVLAFFRKYPQLLDTGWVHTQGYVWTLMEEMKVTRDTPDAQVVLAQYRLGGNK